MNRTQKALATFDQGFNCAQSVCSAFSDSYAVDEQLAMRFAGCFGGGMRCGEVCGAVTGALMIIGLKNAQTEPGDKAAKERCGQITQTFMDRYAYEKGALLCRELLGYDIRDPEAKAKYPDRIRQICPGAIESAVQLLEEMGF